jgi:hypothetical protein
MESLKGMLSDPKNHGRNIPLSDWKEHHAIHVTHARREYLRSWALCYLLLHNPNYSQRFRTLGQRYMSGQSDDFPLLFAAMDREIAFEYAFFLRNIGAGYRVDLCRWDWNKRFRELKRSESMVARVAAARGFQASGLNVVEGESYSYESQGTWSLSQTETPTTADGRNSAGALVGVVLHDFVLSEPFELGARGTFVAPRSGQLYLRCNESFNQIQDNRGSIDVKLADL